MAELHIQEKRGTSWLWWIIGLVILALVAWWLLSMKRGDVGSDNGAVASATVTPAPVSVPGSDSVVATTGTITDLTMLVAAVTPGDLVGRHVALMSAPVASVVSDKGFWVGSGTAAGQGLFVVRGNQNATYTAPDGAVNAGLTVNIWGVVESMPSDLTQQTTEWNLKSTDRDLLASRAVYVHADSVRIVRK